MKSRWGPAIIISATIILVSVPFYIHYPGEWRREAAERESKSRLDSENYDLQLLRDARQNETDQMISRFHAKINEANPDGGPSVKADLLRIELKDFLARVDADEKRINQLVHTGTPVSQIKTDFSGRIKKHADDCLKEFEDEYKKILSDVSH